MRVKEISSSVRGTKPLYRQVEEQLREKILTGVWKVNDPLPPRRALSKELGITRITLDKAIGQLIREGWLYANVGSGTFVTRPDMESKGVDAGPKRTKSTRIGVVLGNRTYSEPNLALAETNDYFGQILHGIRDALIHKNVDIRYLSIDYGGSYNDLKEVDVQGWIVLAPTLGDLAALQKLDGLFPFIAVGISSDYASTPRPLAIIDADNVQGAMQGVRYLIDNGHSEIAFVSLAIDHSNQYDRYRGYVEAMAAAGKRVDPRNIVLYPAYDVRCWTSVLDEWLLSVKQTEAVPTAVFSCDFNMTIAVHAALKRHGLSVPDNVSIVSFDDSAVFAYMTPSITAIRQPAYDLGMRAAERLIEIVDSGQMIDDIGSEKLPTELVVRESVRPL